VDRPKRPPFGMAAKHSGSEPKFFCNFWVSREADGMPNFDFVFGFRELGSVVIEPGERADEKKFCPTAPD
jgi:hypothetical protein